MFSTPEGLSRHRRTLHGADGARVPASARKLYGCSQCEATFARPSALARHTRDAHAAGERLSCKICARSFVASRASELRAHERMHTHVLRCRHGEGYEVCGHITRSRDAMTRHLRTAHPSTRTTAAELVEVVAAPPAEAAAQRRYEVRVDASHLLSALAAEEALLALDADAPAD